MYEERTYRRDYISDDLKGFEVVVKETDLYICAKTDLSSEAIGLTLKYRAQIEGYIERYPEFQTSFLPLPFNLFAPSIIKDYPEAKLIMIATGPYLKPDFKIYNLILRLVKKRKVLETLDKLLKLFPEKSLLFFYKIVNRHHSNGPNDKRLSQWCAGQDIKAFLKISAGKGREIIDYATNIDNQIILGTIRNKTLILGGENDILMPLALSEKLKDLLIDSSLVVTAGEHFNVFNKEGLLKIEKFLAE